MTDPVFDPLVAKLQRQLVRYVIGQKLGQCPVTGQYDLDVDTAIQVWDAEPAGNSKADLKLVVSPAGAHAIKAETVAELGWVIVDPAARKREARRAARTIVGVCATCRDYADDGALLYRHGTALRHVGNNSNRCPGQGDDDTDDRAELEDIACRHCARTIEQHDGEWIDPEAPTDTDDVIWRETCDASAHFTADHEPQEG